MTNQRTLCAIRTPWKEYIDPVIAFEMQRSRGFIIGEGCYNIPILEGE